MSEFSINVGPKPAGKWRHGPKAGPATYLHVYHEPRWLTKRMMAWFFELYWEKQG